MTIVLLLVDAYCEGTSGEDVELELEDVTIVLLLVEPYCDGTSEEEEDIEELDGRPV